MYFPVARLSISPWLPPLVAFGISLGTSMGGVSGAFLLLPFQVSVLGFTSPAVSATNQVFNLIAIPSGVYRYLKEGRMVWPLAGLISLGSLPGVLAGAVIRVRYLPDPRRFTVFAGLVLLYVGLRLVTELLLPSRNDDRAWAEEEFRRRWREADRKEGGPRVHLVACGWRRICYRFQGQDFIVPTLPVLALSLGVGLVGGAYGIGGGAIIAPFLVSVLGLPVYTVAGAALLGTMVTSVAGVACYQTLAHWHPSLAVAPDWPLGLLFGLGGLMGMYCGARLQKFVSARIIKWLLAVFVLIPALRYLLPF